MIIFYMVKKTNFMIFNIQYLAINNYFKNKIFYKITSIPFFIYRSIIFFKKEKRRTKNEHSNALDSSIYTFQGPTASSYDKDHKTRTIIWIEPNPFLFNLFTCFITRLRVHPTAFICFHFEKIAFPVIFGYCFYEVNTRSLISCVLPDPQVPFLLD